MWKAAITELLPAAFYVFILTTTIISILDSNVVEPKLLVPLAIFLILFLFLMMTVPLSGGHESNLNIHSCTQGSYNSCSCCHLRLVSMCRFSNWFFHTSKCDGLSSSTKPFLRWLHNWWQWSNNTSTKPWNCIDIRISLDMCFSFLVWQWHLTRKGARNLAWQWYVLWWLHLWH